MARSLIIGASGGIGTALSDQLSGRGDIITLSRTEDGFDLRDESSIKAGLGHLDGTFDLIFVATGTLEIDGAEPEKTIREVTPKAMADQFAVNAIGPLMCLKHGLHLMPKDRRSVFAALSARVGSIGDNRIGGWTSYRVAKAALNQALHTAAIELKRTHKQAVVTCLHPGTVETDFTAKYASRHKTVPADEAAANLLAVIDGLTPDETGTFFDYAGQEVPW